MICTVRNNASSPRVFYDAQNREINLGPGCLQYVDIDDGTFDALAARTDISIGVATFDRRRPMPAAPPAPAPAPTMSKPAVFVTGHFGIGDNLHQRAIMRELMKTHDVWLHTCHFNLYHDLIEQGLKLILRPTSLHAQVRTIAREKYDFEQAKFPPVPPGAQQMNIGYPKVLIDKHGSILEAQFSCVGMKMPQKPDFRLPLRAEWLERFKRLWFDTWNMKGKPLMVHRPIVVRNEWDGRSRNPDPATYDTLYRQIRDRFFVVSVADLVPGVEWIDGPQQDVDVKLHQGELSFTDMAAMFAEAKLVFCNAGFAPVLAQAVGTPVVVVYGGRESYRTTQRVGAHLAPTLPIDPINPCDCHSAHHPCDKRIDLASAQRRLQEFIEPRFPDDKTLLFGTFYIDSPDRDQLTDLWIKLHTTLNPDCDFLAVDSQSPIQKFADWTPYNGQRHQRMYFNFADNVGHLSRPRVTQGRDGWGRAFCKGLEIACELGYQYAVHIEGDSLLRLRVGEITKQMRAEGIDCISTDVVGMKNPQLDKQWIETGLMFFSTDYIKRSRFIARYDWPNRKVAPTPERYIRIWILQKDLDNKQLRIMPWRALRADKNQINKDNIEALNLDWVTHQHDSAQQGVYQKFVELALTGKEVVQPLSSARVPQPGPSSLVKLNLGCGTNQLAGWENHDADVDITKRLPWDDNTVSHISIEHCVEHVHYRAAIGFFQEARRVLAPGGVLRVTVPSLEQIARCEEADYHQFTTKWQQLGPTKHGAAHAIIYAHGHECAWNAQLMRDTLWFAGFDDVRECKSGESEDPVLRGVEGHGRVIGDKFNLIESCTHEARKPGQLGVSANTDRLINDQPVAIVIGGAECWQQDLEAAKAMLTGCNIRYFFVNDHIGTFPEPGDAVTLHPDKLNGGAPAWLAMRRKNGLVEPSKVWAHRKHPCVTHDTASKEWAGSVGLFAVQVARREGYKHIIGCGVPMTVEGKHFERHQLWQSAISFRQGWLRCREELKPCFRSMSGWTAEQFGRPDEAWLNG